MVFKTITGIDLTDRLTDWFCELGKGKLKGLLLIYLFKQMYRGIIIQSFEKLYSI